MRLKSSESGVVKACLEYLHARGVFCWRQNQVAVHGRRFVGLKGVSDILGVIADEGLYRGYYDTRENKYLYGAFLAVECKTDKGRLSQDQTDFLTKLTCRGGLAIVARSIDDLKEAGL